MEKKTMGGFIAALRRARGLSQQEVADRLNVSNKSVSKWERNESAPDISLIPAIAELFEVSCDEILLGGRITDTSERAAIATKTDHQIRRLAGSTTTKFKNLTLIAILLAGVGAALYFILDFLVDYSVGFFAFMILAVGSIIFEIICYNNATYQLKSNDLAAPDSDILRDARTIIYRCLFATILINILALLFILGMAFGLSVPRVTFAVFGLLLWGSLKVFKNKIGFSEPMMRFLSGTKLRNSMNYIHWALIIGLVYQSELFPGWNLSVFVFLIPLIACFIILTALEKEKTERALTASAGARNLMILAVCYLSFSQIGYLHQYVILGVIVLVALSLLIKHYIIKRASSYQ